jgi:hypothetical protein
VDGGAELTASPEVVLDALAAAFFFPRFLGGMENENGPRRLFPETEVAELNTGLPLFTSVLVLSHYSHTTTFAASAPASCRPLAEPPTLSLAWVHPPLPRPALRPYQTVSTGSVSPSALAQSAPDANGTDIFITDRTHSRRARTPGAV